ncbi:septal ring lytic transglycosylase RlpA family protein [Neisseria iguanae]|uniref:septal ring lytic transglycosylase RlpA family protein n=1 Tax=Neisseria iguanae TaxID=90242 RepID=UPI001FE798AC|nr:septal ring lytic transglycosylase RlpA family protein [Neisseria iguanae]
MTLSHNTLFAMLTAVAIGVFSIGSTSAQTAKGALLAKQANKIIVTGQDTIVRAEKLHPSANRSYKVAGKRYQPMTKLSSFTQNGNASWYGGKFHGRKTASGELYNMYAMTAAHRTLPIPSYAKVTNTRNGKSVIVRVNDRGPFHGNRVMDLSKAAAQKLGFINQGTAHVKIEQIVPGVKSQQAAAPEAVTPKNTVSAAIATLSPVQEIYVDLKVFGTERDAQAYIDQTTGQLASFLTSAKMAVEKRSHEYVVRMGPFTAQERADEAETRVRSLTHSSSDTAI